MVPLLWGPLVVASLAAALWRPAVEGDVQGVAAAISQIVAGVLLWQLAEYSLHRWVSSVVIRDLYRLISSMGDARGAAAAGGACLRMRPAVAAGRAQPAMLGEPDHGVIRGLSWCLTRKPGGIGVWLPRTPV